METEFYKYLAHCLNDKIDVYASRSLDEFGGKVDTYIITDKDIMEAKKAYDSMLVFPIDYCKKCEGLGEYYSDGWGECPRCRGSKREPNT